MENQAPPSLPAPPVETTSRIGPRWNRIFTSAAIAVLAVLAWQSHDLRQNQRAMQADLAHRLANSDKLAEESRTLVRQGQENVAGLQAKVNVLEARVLEAQGQREAMEALYAEVARARDERALVEIEQAVSIAVQQLQLAGNVPAALLALQSADQRLALLDQARFLPLRKLIAADMERLKRLPVSDVASIALKLETLLGRIDSLPLGFERNPPSVPKATRPAGEGVPVAASAPAPAPAEEAPGVFSRLGLDLWGEFRQLIRIERLDRPDPALLAPSHAAHLRENLRLRLLSARLALMQREGKLFAEDVHQAREWLQRYFDVEARPVADALAELAQIERARLTMNLPDLEDTQVALRNIKLGGKR